MEKTIQVKGTLPLVAEYFNAEEKRIYSIFNLNETKSANNLLNQSNKKVESKKVVKKEV